MGPPPVPHCAKRSSLDRRPLTSKSRVRCLCNSTRPATSKGPLPLGRHSPFAGITIGVLPMTARPRLAVAIVVSVGLTCAAGRASGDPPPAAPRPITVPLKAPTTNPNYFTDGSGKAIYLTGSHTWNTVQDWGTNDTIQPLDFKAFVKMLVAHHHNFTLLWTTELPTFRRLPNTASNQPDYTVSPLPWLRTGPGNASDGKPKFDLSKYNQAYFDRLRDRVQQLHAAGIYAGVYLFSGEWLLRLRFDRDC